ncbi:MAG: endo-1,4-beta-xylanase, partial [Spirochaetales bacterium]
LDRLAEAGLPIYVTELDLAIEDDARQAERMRELVTLFWEHPAVHGVTL